MTSNQGPTKQRWRRGPDQSQPSSRDASEEDNDESTEPPTPSSSHVSDAPPRATHFRSTKASAVGMSGEAIARESSLYDGDIESSGASTTGYDAPVPSSAHRTSSSLSEVVAPDADEAQGSQPKDAHAPVVAATPIIELPEEDIRAFVQRALDGESEVGWPERNFKVNPPATDRPVRIYADGVYDLCHFGHALQMRQAKLSFPSVHLLIGVCSDELCRAHKSLPAMTHAERCASVKHCRWVDEVVPDAPWEITQEFIDRYEIDYVAHDEEPYTSAGKEDVYDFVKKQGRFLPTRRTPGISTSELLERIVSQYRAGVFDGKLEKIGHAELKADRVQWGSATSSP